MKLPIQPQEGQSDGLTRWARKSRSALELVREPPIIIINPPPPPIALPWSFGNCSHHLANSVLINFAFWRGWIRPLVLKLRTTGNLTGAHLKLYLGVFLVFPKCISVFPTTFEGLAQSVDSKCHIGKWIWRSGSAVMVGGKVSIPSYQTVFGSYLGCICCISELYFCMSDLTGGPGSIWSFRKSPREVKSEVRVKSYGRSKSIKKSMFWHSNLT